MWRRRTGGNGAEEVLGKSGRGGIGDRERRTTFLNDQDQFESPIGFLSLFLTLPNDPLKAGDVVQLVECLLSMHKALDLIPALHTLGTITHAWCTAWGDSIRSLLSIYWVWIQLWLQETQSGITSLILSLEIKSPGQRPLVALCGLLKLNTKSFTWHSAFSAIWHLLVPFHSLLPSLSPNVPITIALNISSTYHAPTTADYCGVPAARHACAHSLSIKIPLTAQDWAHNIPHPLELQAASASLGTSPALTSS